MLIVALVLAVIGLAALVTAVVTSNELVAWVCIAASVVGVLLLTVDALRERSRRAATDTAVEEAEAELAEAEAGAEFDADYPDDDSVAEPSKDGAEQSKDVAEPSGGAVDGRRGEVTDEERETR